MENSMKRRAPSVLALATIILLVAGVPPAAQQEPPPSNELAQYIKANYSKREVMVPMRDGIQLFTSIYEPKDASPQQKYPILLDRTPYTVAPYGRDSYRDVLGPSLRFAYE